MAANPLNSTQSNTLFLVNDLSQKMQHQQKAEEMSFERREKQVRLCEVSGRGALQTNADIIRANYKYSATLEYMLVPQ